MLTPSLEISGDGTAFDGIKLDVAAHQLMLGEREIYLTMKEFDLLLFFTNNKGKAFRRSQIISEVWGDSHLATDRTVDIHVCRLRKKIEADPDEPRRIVTINRIGYRFKG